MSFVDSNIKRIPERKFKDEKLRIEALTHKSYAYENPMSGNHNERLEFLGDAIISFIVADYLHDRFKEFKEGQLTTLRAKLVCKQTLSYFAVQLGLNDHLRLGAGATTSNARNSEKTLEDTFEAYMGAVFLDTNKNYGEVMKFMEPLLTPRVDQLVKDGVGMPNNDPSRGPYHRPTVGPLDESLNLPQESDPINKLQTWSQRRAYGIPQYNELEKTGFVHNPQFTFEVVINGRAYGNGTARNKKDAKRQAAINALQRLVPSNNNDDGSKM
ncbi:ribonuclease III [Glomus cerebriforme]|uniref:ribonuclease III n=1 Tax=Glomus cerebriforme TaxID=658196 RepID=A0A397SZ58_9GLOM|nr:ribonuclease III [Glomus cerebriforme]